MTNLSLDDLLDYNKAVEHFANNKVDNVLSNKGDDHAIIIFNNIFRTAERDICLYARDIFSCENIVTNSPSYIESLRTFLNREGAILRIVLQSYDEETSRNYLRQALQQYSSKIELRKNLDGEIKIGDTSVHLCIADGRMYRVEYNPDERKARCNFNDGNAVYKYQLVFNQLFKASAPTQL